MREPNRRLGGMRRAIACVVAVLLTWMASVPARAASPASGAEVAASLAGGVAWIWPDSNGPLPRSKATELPYREAAVLVESLMLRADRVEHGGRTQPLALPAGVRLVPVVHVEAAADAPDDFTAAQRGAIVAAVRR